MKKISLLSLSLVLCFLFVNNLYTQDTKTIPSVTIKNLKNESIDTKLLNNDGKPFIIDFWATWCKPCVIELKTINEVYSDWQEKYGVKFIAVSIDDSRNSKRVAPFVKGQNWAFDVYLDENSDFKRAMNVNNPPHTFLFNGKGQLVWEHNGFAPGDEEEIENQIKKLLESENKK